MVHKLNNVRWFNKQMDCNLFWKLLYDSCTSLNLNYFPIIKKHLVTLFFYLFPLTINTYLAYWRHLFKLDVKCYHLNNKLEVV